MCGIFGAVGRSISSSALERVFQTLHHRGPDGRGSFIDPSARLTLAHTRLAVIDLVTGEQPLHSADGNVVLIANGEIYGFEQLKSALQAKGHRFSTNSDSEVIIGLYQQHGLGCFEHLRGEFAFLLYDKSKRLLVAARDRFGIKPLYWSRLTEGFVFASEMKAIFASGLLAPRLNAAGFDPLSERDPEHAHFPFEGIEQVSPGCYVAIDFETGEACTSRYWSADIPDEAAAPVVEPASAARTEASRAILQELEEAVQLRLRADVPVGLYLSGGIDSAFVGALMKRKRQSERHSFSIGFSGSGKDERLLAREAADFLGTRHHELVVTKDMLWECLEDCLWFSELPFVSLAPVGKYLLSAEARKIVTVVLTGEGADEVFLGYRRYFQSAIRETRAPRSRSRGADGLRRLRISGLSATFASSLSLLAFHKSCRPALAAARASQPAHTSSRKPIINAVQEARLAGMPKDILCYLGDREEMAHSLEARLPFLDHLLFDRAKAIPVDFKVRGGLEKAVLRDAASDILPDHIRLRRKTGFMATSEAVDIFGEDRRATAKFGKYLSREAFEQAQIFSYRAYRFACLLARLPRRGRVLPRLRQNANKVILYMMQAHLLHEMFVAQPRWEAGDTVQ